MKQLWLGLGILLGLFAVCFGALDLLGTKNDRTAALLAKAQYAGVQADFDTALQFSLDAQAQWENSAGFMDTMMSHEETDDIKREFSDLLVYCTHEKQEEFLSSCGRLLVMVEHLTEMERPLWRNIL